ncbi:MAG: aldo/keto reductase [Pseudomonadota bacterium]
MEWIENGTALAGLPRLCVGCEQLGGVDWGEIDSEELERAMQLAVVRGARFFDTAGIYGLGESERRLKGALSDKRHDQFIATKGGLVVKAVSDGQRATVVKNATGESLRRCVNESLERLEVERIPLFYIHWPDPTTPLSESAAELKALKEEGLVEHVGLSNFSLEDLKRINNIVPISAVQIPGNYLSPPDHTILDYCQKQAISVCVYGVLAQGLLTGKYSKATRFDESDRRHRLQHFSQDAWDTNDAKLSLFFEVAGRVQRPPVQVAIRCLLQTPGVSSVVVGIKSQVQLEECLAALDWRLPESELNDLYGAHPGYQ